MSDAFILKILDRFSGLFRLLGADYHTFRLIMGFKLKMDQRRVPTIMNNSMQKENAVLTPFLKSLLFYALMGLMLIPFLIFGDYYYFQMSIVFSLIMFILTTSMISDFSSVLLDVRDKVILDTKPVDRRTISLAKFTHVVIYMTQLTGAFMLIPFIVSSFVQGLYFSLLLLISLILLSIFSIVLTALFYMTILKFFDGDRLRNLINYIQIFLSIALVFGYQLISRSFTFVDMSFTVNWEWWHLLLPPLWFSAIFEVLLSNNHAIGMIVSACLAVVIPIIALWLYFNLMPAFEQNLSKLMNTSGGHKEKKRYFSHFIAKIVCRNQQEHAIFGFARAMFSQERDFKLKVYPILGISIALPIFVIVMPAIDGIGVNQHLDYLYGYFSLLTIPTVVHMLKFSSKSNGAYIYRVLSAQDEGLYYKTTLKAFLVQLFLPVVFALSVIYTILLGPISIVHFTIILLVGCILTPISYNTINKGRFPFNEPFSVAESGNSITMFVMMFAIGFLAFIHYLVNEISFGVYLYIPLLLVISLLSWKKVFATN